MPSSKFIMPTGFEAEQKQAEEKRAIAKAMLERGLSPSDNMRSWAQVLGSIAQTWAGKSLSKDADKLDAKYYSDLSSTYAKHLAAFNADEKAGKDPAYMRATYDGDPFLTDEVKPYNSAFERGLTDRASLTTDANGQVRPKGDLVGKPNIDYNKGIIPTYDASGNVIGHQVNTLATAGALERQGYGVNPSSNFIPMPGSAGVPPANPAAPVTTPPPTVEPYYNPSVGPAPPPIDPHRIGFLESRNRDFAPNGLPVTSSAGARYSMQVMPSTAADPGFGVPPVPAWIRALPDNDPRKAAAYDHTGVLYAQAMQRRYGDAGKAAGAYNAGPGAMDRALAGNQPNWLGALPQQTQQYVHSYLALANNAQRPPDGMTTDGKPYWMLNGVAFDNPEGR